jgi:uncharacterized protein (DUF2062 family)
LPFRWGWKKLKAWFLHLLHLDDSAHRIALGVAVGMFVAMTPTWGIQMAMIVGISWLVRANKVSGIACAWVTNPLTTVPIYSFNYAVGQAIVGGPGLQDFRHRLELTLSMTESWGTMARAWWGLMLQVALPLWVGCVVVGLASGAVTYVAFYYLINFYRRHRHHRPADTAAADAAAGNADKTNRREP